MRFDLAGEFILTGTTTIVEDFPKPLDASSFALTADSADSVYGRLKPGDTVSFVYGEETSDLYVVSDPVLNDDGTVTVELAHSR